MLLLGTNVSSGSELLVLWTCSPCSSKLQTFLSAKAQVTILQVELEALEEVSGDDVVVVDGTECSRKSYHI
jgi:TusA-related sulfurtransferase